MNAEPIGQDRLVSVGTPAGRYWVSHTSAPGGFAFEQLIASRPALRNYYSDLEIALMAEYPELFNDPATPEQRAFTIARQRAIEPLLEAGGEVEYEPAPAKAALTAQELALPVATGAGIYAATMAGESMGQVTVPERWTAFLRDPIATIKQEAALRLERAHYDPAVVEERLRAIAADMKAEERARGTGLAWPVAVGVLAFSLLGLQ